MRSSRLSRFVVPLLILVVSLIFFATSTSPSIWPLRNTVIYQTNRLMTGEPHISPPNASAGSGTLAGCVRDAHGAHVAGATVLVSAPDGTTFHSNSGSDGCFALTGVPAGRYVPVAGAPGYDNVALRPWGLPLSIGAGATRALNIDLPPVSLPTVAPGRDLRLGEPITREWSLPVRGMAVERSITFDSGGKPNQLALLYTPITATERLPLLLAVYPGPADTWWPVSIPLASAGYSVLAVGPTYALDLEPDIDELQRLVAFARAGRLPGVDGRHIALLGGSYSSLHVLRLLERDVGFAGAVLLGPPSDLFDMRRRFEEGSIFPPFGLDRALIALGTPDTDPETYWRYSAAFHLRDDLPPILLMHSRQDEIIPYQQSEILAAALTNAGVQHEDYFFDGMKHYLLATEPSPELTHLYELTLAFLRRNLSDNK